MTRIIIQKGGISRKYGIITRQLTKIFLPLTTWVVTANASIKRWETMEVLHGGGGNGKDLLLLIVEWKKYDIFSWQSLRKCRDDSSDPWIFMREPESPCGRSRWRWIFRWTTQHQFLCESKAQFTDAKVTWGKCSKTPQKEKGRKRKILFVSSVDWGFASHEKPWNWVQRIFYVPLR